MAVDKTVHKKVVTFLEHLHIKPEQAQAYLYLLENGPQTVLALSRGLEAGRTKLYPLLDDLAQKQLISVHERHYGTSYEACSPDVLAFLVAEKQRQAEALQSELPAIQNMLEQLKNTSPTHSKIIEYRGIDGLKQMNWNLTKAEKEFRVFELQNISSHLGKHFAEKLRTNWAENRTASFDLTNNPHWQLDTNIDTYKQNAQARYIDPTIFDIQFETYIYNNCVALLSYENDDIFGVEIYNQKLTKQQTQLFDLLWKQAKALA